MLAAWLNKIKLQGNGPLPVFFVCVFIAIVFWVLNSLNKEYNYTLSFPLEIANMPYTKRMVNTTPDSVKVLCKARGFELFWFYLKHGNKKITIDLAGKNNSADKISIGMSNEFVNRFKNDMHDMEIISAQPDSIHLFLSSRYLKKVPVVSNLKFTLKNRFGISGKIKIEPDSVLISGDKADIANVSQIFTAEKELNAIDETTTLEINITKPSATIFLSANTVRITVPVEEFTEGQISMPVPVQILNGKKIIALPASVAVSYRTTLSNYKGIVKDSFLLGAEPIMLGESKKLKVTILKSPVNAKVIAILPPTVDYYFEK